MVYRAMFNVGVTTAQVQNSETRCFYNENNSKVCGKVQTCTVPLDSLNNKQRNKNWKWDENSHERFFFNGITSTVRNTPNGILFGISGLFVLSAFTVSALAGNQNFCLKKKGETTWLCVMLFS